MHDHDDTRPVSKISSCTVIYVSVFGLGPNQSNKLSRVVEIAAVYTLQLRSCFMRHAVAGISGQEALNLKYENAIRKWILAIGAY